MPHENSLKNLEGHKFLPGNNMSKGRPKGKMLSTALREILEKEIDFEDPILRQKYCMTAAHAIGLKLVKRALEGNLKAIEMVLDRMEGKPSETLEIGGIEGQPVTIEAHKVDYSNLSSTELKFLLDVCRKIGYNDSESTGLIIDAEQLNINS